MVPHEYVDQSIESLRSAGMSSGDLLVDGGSDKAIAMLRPVLESLAPAKSDYVDDSGEGRWTVHDSIDLGVPTPVLTLALQMRFRSRQDPSFGGKVLNAMRAGFGGHNIKLTEKFKKAG